MSWLCRKFAENVGIAFKTPEEVFGYATYPYASRTWPHLHTSLNHQLRLIAAKCMGHFFSTEVICQMSDMATTADFPRIALLSPSRPIGRYKSDEACVQGRCFGCREGPKKAFSPTKQDVGPKLNPELGSAFDQLAAKFAGKYLRWQEQVSQPAKRLCNMCLQPMHGKQT